MEREERRMERGGDGDGDGDGYQQDRCTKLHIPLHFNYSNSRTHLAGHLDHPHLKPSRQQRPQRWQQAHWNIPPPPIHFRQASGIFYRIQDQ